MILRPFGALAMRGRRALHIVEGVNHMELHDGEKYVDHGGTDRALQLASEGPSLVSPLIEGDQAGRQTAACSASQEGFRKPRI